MRTKALLRQAVVFTFVLGCTLITGAQTPASPDATSSLSASPEATTLADRSVRLDATRDQAGLIAHSTDGKRYLSNGAPVTDSIPNTHQSDLSIFPLPTPPLLQPGQAFSFPQQMTTPRLPGEPAMVNPILGPSLRTRDLDTLTVQPIHAGDIGYRQPTLPASSATSIVGIPEPFTAAAEAAYLNGSPKRRGAFSAIAPHHALPSQSHAGGPPARTTNSFHP